MTNRFLRSTCAIAVPVAMTLGLAACGGSAGSSGNQSPVARLSGPQDPMVAGEPIKLDARDSSDADQDTLSYEWALAAKPAGSSATLSEGTGLRFLLPDVAGRYDVNLRVTDGKGGESRLTRSLEVQTASPLAIVMTETEPVSGLVHLRLNRDTVVADVLWYGDGAPLNATRLPSSMPIEWETGFLSDGPHVVQAKLRFVDGSERAIERTVQVLNPTIKLTRPYVETYFGRAAVYVEAQSVYGIDRVSLSLKGVLLGELTERNDCGLTVCQQAPTGYAFNFTKSQTGAGLITLELKVQDKAGNSRVAQVPIDMGP